MWICWQRFSERDLNGSPGNAMREELDWRWQLRNRVRTLEGLRAHLDVTPDEARAIGDTADIFHFAVTPYYLGLADPSDPQCPIRRQVIPTGNDKELKMDHPFILKHIRP